MTMYQNSQKSMYIMIIQNTHRSKEYFHKYKRMWPNYFREAGDRELFSGAIPLLLHTQTFACCVTTLGQYVHL